MFTLRRAALALPLALAALLLGAGATAHPAPSPSAESGQLTRGAANPILRNDSSYDDLKAGPSTVVKAGAGDYRQWYEAIDEQSKTASGNVLSQTGYATSSDGTVWSKRGIVFAPLKAPSWENGEACPTSMHWDGSKWILFYHGGNNDGVRAISRATSPTGTGDFTRSGGPILQRGAPGAWDERFVADAKVVPPWEGPDAVWRMYYIGRNAAGKGQVGLATSQDGVAFTKYGSAPVVGLGSPGAWDGSDIQAFTPEWDAKRGLFRAWYVAGSAAGYLWSPDGVKWTRGTDNPVLKSVPGDNVEDSIDSYLDEGRYRIVYGQYDLLATPKLRGKGEAWLAEDAAPAPAPGPAPAPAPAPGGTTAAIAVSASDHDGDVERGSATYPPAANAETFADALGERVLVRRSKTPWPYQPVRVGLLRFDTGWLPDGAIIQSAELQLHVTGKSSTNGLSLVAEWYGSGAWPIDGGDWAFADSATAHGGTPLHEIATDRQAVFSLKNLQSINLTGPTALRLHMSGSGTSPTGANDLAFAALDHPSLPAPTLVVRYTLPS